MIFLAPKCTFFNKFQGEIMSFKNMLEYFYLNRKIHIFLLIKRETCGLLQIKVQDTNYPKKTKKIHWAKLEHKFKSIQKWSKLKKIFELTSVQKLMRFFRNSSDMSKNGLSKSFIL